jgi:hypothetical protein
MSHPNKSRFVISDRVRPSIEIVEPDPSGPGFRVAAIIYGDDKEEVALRADLVSRWMSVEGSRSAIRKRLKAAATYQWAVRMHRRGGLGSNLALLLVWLLGCLVDMDATAVWLRDTWQDTSLQQRLRRYES